MSLEAQLTELNENVKHQNALLQQLLEDKDGPVTDGGDKQPAPAEPEPDPAPEPGTTEDQGTEEQPTAEAAKEAFTAVIAGPGNDAAREILGRFSAKKFSEVPEDQYGAFVEACKEATDAG